MAKSVIGFFERNTEAQDTVQDLERSGFRREGIDTITPQEADRERDLTDRLARLGVPADDARLYREGLQHGGSLVALVTDDTHADQAAEIMNAHGAKDIGELAGQWRQTAAPAPTAQPTQPVREAREGETHIPVVEEELKVGKRRVERGGVRITTQVTEQPVEEQIRLREEHATVERHPVDRPARPEDITMRPGETIEVREMREEPVVQKEARVVEEVVVGKESEERTETVRETVHRQDVQIQQISEEEYAPYETEFRNEFTRAYAGQGVAFEDYSPAYRYGFELGRNPRYAGRDWNLIESEARRDWEQRHPGSAWDRFRDSIRFGWERARRGR